MKQLASLLMIAFIAFSCNTEKSNAKSDLEESNLKGKVWKIEKNIHETNQNMRCPCGGEKDECKQMLFVYNKKGNLVESSELDDQGKILLTSRYAYNRGDVCSEIKRYSGDKYVGKKEHIIQRGRVTEVREIDEDGKIENVIKNEYTAGEISGGKVLNKIGEVVSSFHNEFSNGQLDVITEKNAAGDILSVSKYKRNSSNDVVELIKSYPKDSREIKFTFTYDYDNNGNWTQQTLLFDGEIAGIFVRNITYYD